VIVGAVRALDAYPDRRARRRVRADVGEQVVDRLTQPVSVAEDNGLVDTRLDRSARVDRACSVDRLADDLGEPHVLALERSALVESSEEEKVVDEEAHALGLAPDACHRALQVGPRCGAAVEERSFRSEASRAR
jgi:hypothetical protein